MPCSRTPARTRSIDVVAIAILDDDGIDAGLVQQLPEDQARGTGADDSDLRAFGLHHSSRVQLDAFDQHRDTLTDADAHRAQPVARRSCDEAG